MTTEKKNETMTMLVIGLLVLNILFGVYLSFFKRDALWLETLKVGGADNMKLAVQLYQADSYKQQQKTTLEEILGSMNTAGATQPQAPTDSQAGATAVQGDTAKFAAIIKDGYILGKKDARITIIEYSDFLCPFCKRHYDAQTIENLIKKYPNDVNMVFRQMPLPQLHPTAPI
jgi:protein-disulfide isomerase